MEYNTNSTRYNLISDESVRSDSILLVIIKFLNRSVVLELINIIFGFLKLLVCLFVVFGYTCTTEQPLYVYIYILISVDCVFILAQLYEFFNAALESNSRLKKLLSKGKNTGNM
jgi:hypothetical protein